MTNWHHPLYHSSLMAHTGRSALQAAFREVKVAPPRILAKTRAKAGPVRANKQRVAIALNKARESGAKIPYAGIKKG